MIISLEVVDIQQSEQVVNYWKWACLIIIAINILFGAYIFQALVKPITPLTNQQTTNVDTTHKIKTTVSLNKSEIETLFNQLLPSQQYQLSLTNEIQITGKIDIFMLRVDVQIIGTPYATENGNLQIKVNSVRAGDLKLPINMMLGFVQNAPDFPKWITVDGANKVLTVQLADREWQNGVTIKVLSFDLATDKFLFEIGISNEVFWQNIKSSSK